MADLSSLRRYGPHEMDDPCFPGSYLYDYDAGRGGWLAHLNVRVLCPGLLDPAVEVRVGHLSEDAADLLARKLALWVASGQIESLPLPPGASS